MIKKSINNAFFFKKYGFCLYYNKEIKRNISLIKKNFTNNFKSRFKSSQNRNLNIIKRFNGEISINKIFFDKNLLNFIKKLGVKYPVQTGPVVTHYSSNDKTSKSYGLGLHQDWPSMCTSINGVVIWFNINNYNHQHKNNLGLQLYKNFKKNYLFKTLKSKSDINFIPEDIIEKNNLIDCNPKNEVLIMSTFCVHRTIKNKNLKKKYWRLGISTRFDDLKCKKWNRNNYVSAYSTSVNRDLYKKFFYSL
jgi:hypothetical protein